MGIEFRNFNKEPAAWHPSPHPLQFRNLGDLERSIRSSIQCLPGDVSLVVGIPRSGMCPAGFLSTLLNVPLLDLESFLAKRHSVSGCRPMRNALDGVGTVVIVDDSVASGRQMIEVKKRVSLCRPEANAFFMAVYGRTVANTVCDFVCETIDDQRIFSWNAVNSWVVRFSCVDIDGLLCPDPLPRQNDDGQLYRDFIDSTSVLYDCRYKIAHLVTARLEKYRSATVSWLERNGIEFEHLHMINLPDANSRNRLGGDYHAKHKAKVYRELLGVNFFIESTDWQSALISKYAAKPVLSVQSGKIYLPDQLSIRREQIRYYGKHPRALAGLLRQRLLG